MSEHPNEQPIGSDPHAGFDPGAPGSAGDLAPEAAPAPAAPPAHDDAPQPSAALAAGQVPVAALAAGSPDQHAGGDLIVPDGYQVLEGAPDGFRRAVGVVVSRFNGSITSALLDSCLRELEAQGVSRDAVLVMPVPGAFELPLAAMALAKTRRYACIVALGCIIRGETSHFDFVASEAASGLQLAAIETGVPVAFGVLTTEDVAQAEARADKGAEAARTALEMADAFARLRAAAAAAR
jgi:6,7-dimethyl-8-ribityllumazine synthase